MKFGVRKMSCFYRGIDELLLEPCCALKYYPEIELCVKEVEGEEISRRKQKERKQMEDFGDSKVGRLRKFLWNMTEYPETSKAAQVSTVRRLHMSKLVKRNTKQKYLIFSSLTCISSDFLLKNRSSSSVKCHCQII